jgi:hypothetical protein
VEWDSAQLHYAHEGERGIGRDRLRTALMGRRDVDIFHRLATGQLEVADPAVHLIAVAGLVLYCEKDGEEVGDATRRVKTTIGKPSAGRPARLSLKGKTQPYPCGPDAAPARNAASLNETFLHMQSSVRA